MTRHPAPARLGLFALLLLLAACASRTEQTPVALAGEPVETQIAEGLGTHHSARGLAMGAPVILVEDRFEGFNRAVYRFNFEVDQYVLLPIVRGYRFIVPRPVRTGVSNFFSNLGEIRNASNGLLQARPEVASRATIRFLVNSTIGVLGFFDVATRLGVDQQREDFGQTLGWWGVAAGPYLVLPILGPSSVRDAVGVSADIALGALAPPGAQINDTLYATPAPYPLQVVDARYAQPFRYYDSGTPFEYDLVRFLYLRAREVEIRR
jgi:phospholipid-binding lipoprotein MlaA